jgi:hypothetical protein
MFLRKSMSFNRGMDLNPITPGINNRLIIIILITVVTGLLVENVIALSKVLTYRSFSLNSGSMSLLYNV